MALFLAGFFVLFFELACIRWFPAYVIFLQFFSNVILVASFLGMSLGCLLGRSNTIWLQRFPRLAFFSCVAAIAVFALYNYWSDLAISVSTDGFSKAVFFGVEERNVDLARFTVPIEVVACFFYVLVALLFLGPGQILGRCFNAAPDRIKAYAINIAGSLAGIACFALLSALSAPAWSWFLVAALCVGVFLFWERALQREHVVYLAATVLLVMLAGTGLSPSISLHWSPYYLVTHNKEAASISVDALTHQSMVGFQEGGAAYSLIHLLRRDAGQKSFARTLIIGAGSGNDVSHALRHGAEHVDAVEIDPAIQEIGERFHIDQPYRDKRVAVHIDDGRHFLRSVNVNYDLIVYALVDSLKLASGFSSVRLENFLFTREAFEDVKRRLAPGGIFVTYNCFRQGWVVARIADMLTDVFGTAPLVLTIPPAVEVDPDGEPWSGLSIMIAGDTAGIRSAFERAGRFSFNPSVGRSLQSNGFADLPAGQGEGLALRLTSISRANPPLVQATDDWPHLYLRAPSLPLRPYLSTTICLVLLSLAMVFVMVPQSAAKIDGRMFFLGAGFLLIETKAVVQLALLFGGTWIVNSAVFFSILLMVLFSNIAALLFRKVDRRWCYGALFAALALSYAVPLDLFLHGSPFWRYGASTLLAVLPVLFAGIIFADAFRRSSAPDYDYASNVAGAIVGAWVEPLSMIFGFRGLGLVAMAFYGASALSGITGRGIRRSAI